jgi:hypothetical protein
MTYSEPPKPAAARGRGVARRYRSAIPVTVGWVVGLFVLLLGLDMVIYGARAGGGATGVGVVVMVGACVVVGDAVASYAELTPAGLAYRYTFRRKVIPWDCLESLHIGRGPGISVLSGLWVDVRGGGPVLVGSIAGTRRYVGRVISDIEAYRRHVQLTVAGELD